MSKARTLFQFVKPAVIAFFPGCYIHCTISSTQTAEESSLHLPAQQHHTCPPETCTSQHQHGHGLSHPPEEGPAGVADPCTIVTVGGGHVPAHRTQ